MSDSDTAVLATQNGQREHAKRATLEMLRNKKPSEREVLTRLDPEGEQVSFLLRAMSATGYDRLVTKHPPTAEQQVEGAQFNVDSFAPALMARVIIEPEAEESFWRERWDDQNWGRGEIASLYFACSELCNRGLDLVPFGAGSDGTAASGSS
jgi:hypothetical protein